MLHHVSIAPTPKAFIAQLVRHPVPWTIDCLFDAADMSRIERRGGRSESRGDVVAEAAVAVCPGEVVCGLVEDEAIVRKLFLQLGNLLHLTDDPCPRSTMADDFHMEGIVTFLSHGPVDAFGVGLVVHKEEFLAAVEGRVWEFVRSGVEVLGMDRATASASPQQLRAGRVPVDHNEGGDLILAVVRGDLEDVVDGGLLKVDAPSRAGVDTRLWTSQRWGSCFLFFVTCNMRNLRINIPLHEHVYDLLEWRGVLLCVNLEELRRGREHGWDWVGRHHGLAVGAEVMDRRRGHLDV